MNIKKRFISVLSIFICMVLIILVGASFFSNNVETNKLSKQKTTIHLWYTDDALTDYLNSKAVAFYEKTDIRVELDLVSGVEYLEQINQASIDEKTKTPDIYIVTNDSLEKAYLAGLASKVENTDLLDDENRFCDTARNAVRYKEKYVGYPFYFETAALLYNKSYLDEIALASQSEESEQEPVTDASQLIPESIVDILNFADLYSAPENVEYFFKWDVSDIFYNYFFIGHYLTVGGDAGDDETNINIYNTGSISCLKVYQELKQFFSMDADEVDYQTVMNDFQTGKSIYTIATSDCIRTLEEAKKNGEFPYEYGIAPLPNINRELYTEGMSVTNALVVNGYSLQKAEATQFIEYMLEQNSQCELFELSGKLPAEIHQDENEAVQAFQDNYSKSVPIPKMLTASNFWLELESCFAKVWNGADANTEIRKISEKINTQISGEKYEEIPLPDPKIELLPAVEYEDSGEME